MKHVVTIIFALLLFGCNSESAKEEVSKDTSSNAVMLNINAPIETADWSKLIGSWDCVSKDLYVDKWIVNKASWKWEYILDGHAVQDFWWQDINDPNSKLKEFLGTNIRIFNPKTKLWDVTWINNRSYATMNITAKRVVDKMIMTDKKKSMEVTFYDMEENSFKWKAELLNEDNTRTLISEIFGTRIK